MTAAPELQIIGIPFPQLKERIDHILQWFADSQWRETCLMDGEKFIKKVSIDDIKWHYDNNMLLQLVGEKKYTTKTNGKSELMIVENPDNYYNAETDGGTQPKKIRMRPFRIGSNYTAPKKKRKKKAKNGY